MVSVDEERVSFVWLDPSGVLREFWIRHIGAAVLQHLSIEY